ncbi:MAG: uroporphyrinogen decarboxylase family protein [Planctomycetota bacterium]|nr:uroporphyrinogen decarboxylase family protein [Planctomycetota bacterium]
MKTQLTSKERITAALENQSPDHVPLCFMIFGALQSKCSGQPEFVREQLALGLDAVVSLPSLPLHDPTETSDLPGLPVRFNPGVMTREWREDLPGERYPLLHKEYTTPSGPLTTAVQKSEDWPYKDHVPFLDDYLIPRSKKFLVTEQDDLECLQHLLRSPTPADIATFRENAAEAKKLAEEQQLLTTGGWGAGMDMACWLCGMENLMFFTFDQPDFVHEMGGMLSNWNRGRMEVMLDAGLDLFIRRGWYENADFWSPEMYRKFILPDLKKDVALAHEAGAKFAYIMTSSSTPLLEMIVEAGVDVLVGIDPVQGNGTVLPEVKQAAEGKICLWGGVNGFVTVEMGTETQVRAAVAEAIQTLGPDGFILSPVDNIRDESDKAWQNVLVFIQAWKEMRG